MTDALLVSNAILWCLVIVLALVVLALARQVGVLHERVAPAGALMRPTGPRSASAPSLHRCAISGRRAHRRRCCGGRARNAGVVGVADLSGLPDTGADRRVMAQAERLRLVFASDGDKLEQHRAYVEDLRIDDYPYVVSQAFGMSYAVSKLPFAVLIGADGVLRSKGLVNTREHLESLVEAMRSGIATLQDYAAGIEQLQDASLRGQPS